MEQRKYKFKNQNLVKNIKLAYKVKFTNMTHELLTYTRMCFHIQWHKNEWTEEKTKDLASIGTDMCMSIFVNL